MSTDRPAEPDQPARPSAPTTGTPTAEGMLMIGAALVLGVYLVFELLMGEYFQSWIILVAAVFALVLPRVDRSSTERIAPMPVLLKALGYVVAVAGLLDALNAIRFGQLDEAIEIVGALIAFAGYVLSFLGARGLRA